MEQLQLAGTGRITTRLGFGCSTLIGSLNQKQAAALLDATWDAGIRHIDVAPMYGWGAAESCVGEFLRRKSGQVTVTTKFGILPPQKQTVAGLARRIARPIVRALPGIKQQLARAASATLGGSQKANVNVEEARASLERSRKALQTDCIDLWLLHDVAASRLTDPNLLDFMREAVAAGSIGAFGASHDIAEIHTLFEERREFCNILQFEWSVYQSVPQFPGSFRIHHRALAHNYTALHAELKQRPDLCRRWSDELGCDMNSPAVIASLMLKAALVMNPDSIVLVSTKNPVHIAANVKTAEDSSLDKTARRFFELVQCDLSKPRQATATGVETDRG